MSDEFKFTAQDIELMYSTRNQVVHQNNPVPYVLRAWLWFVASGVTTYERCEALATEIYRRNDVLNGERTANETLNLLTKVLNEIDGQ